MKLTVLFLSGLFSMGWTAFQTITPNVKEEGAMKEDRGMQDTPYSEVGIIDIVLRRIAWVAKSTNALEFVLPMKQR